MVDIRPELSKRNKYYISRHRYYELKHFCLQYNEWKDIVKTLDGYRSPNLYLPAVIDIGDPTGKAAVLRESYFSRIKLVEDCAHATDDVLGRYILKAVTEGKTYSQLNADELVPCCKDIFYENYRKFFWILSTQVTISYDYM